MHKSPASRASTRRALLDQQLWYIGRDITAEAGNGLIRFGFRRIRSAAAHGTSCYLLEPPAEDGEQRPHPRVLCWGFGLYIGDALVSGESLATAPLVRHGTAVRGVLLERFSPRPRLTRSPVLLPVHQPAELTRFEAGRDAHDAGEVRALVGTLASVMSRYERWALDTLGDTHRRSALADVPRHKRQRFLPDLELSTPWDEFALRWHRAQPRSAA